MQMPYEIEPRAFLNVQNVIRNIVYYISAWALRCLTGCPVIAGFYASRPAMKNWPIWLTTVERDLKAAAPERRVRVCCSAAKDGAGRGWKRPC